jgi:hypothetical protein
MLEDRVVVEFRGCPIGVLQHGHRPGATKQMIPNHHFKILKLLFPNILIIFLG